MDIGNGCTVNNLDDYKVTTLPVQQGRRRVHAEAVDDSINELLDQSLRDADLTLLAGISFKEKTQSRRRRRQLQAPTLDVAVAEQESAVVLVEGKGSVFSWVYPEEGVVSSTRRGRKVRHLKFTLGATDRQRQERPGQRSIVGWIASTALEPVKAFVLKFVAEKSIDIAVRSLEGDCYIGPVILERGDPFSWNRRDDYRFPDDRPAKILLFVHGTFSSTEGSFGALTATVPGHLLLNMLMGQYDLVLGFDHKTLALDPDQNARQILKALQQMRLPENSTIDALAFSRGGLVYRQLAEVLLPEHRPDIQLDKAVFVACTNAGTNLAEPEHWDVMLDLYTNIMLAGVRAVSVLGGAPVAGVIGEGIKLLGRFAKLIPQTAIDHGYVPGLAAMDPDGQMVQVLNSGTPNLDRLASYYAVTSDFDAEFDSSITVNGLSSELFEFLLDRVSNRLFQENNDLVVHTRSMTDFGGAQAKLVPDGQLDFGSSDDIYHTVYFTENELIEKLIDWFAVEGEPALAGMDSYSESQGLRRPMGPETPSLPSSDEHAFKSVDTKTERASRVSRDRKRDPLLTEKSREPVGKERLVELFGSLSNAGAGAGIDLDEAIGDDSSVDLEAAGVEEPASAGERDRDGLAAESAGEGRYSSGLEATVSSMDEEDQAEEDELTECFFAAEMQPYPEIEKPTSLFVTISPEEILTEDHAAAAATSEGVTVERDTDLEVEVIALSNCEVIGKAKYANIGVPSHNPKIIKFSILSRHPGQAELLVEARQKSKSLASLKLAPIFIDSATNKLAARQSIRMPRRGLHNPAILRIYELYGVARELKLRFDLSCEDPNLHVMEIKNFHPSFNTAAFVATILDEIEDAYNQHSKHYDSFKEDLKDKGTIWADELLPKAVRDALWQHRDDIMAIQVISEESQIPWELLYLEDPDADETGSGFLSEWGLVRWLHNAPWPSYQLRAQQAHYVIPSYKHPRYKLVGAQKEKRMFKRLFPGAREVKAGKKTVRNFLHNAQNDCDILHFACHGEVQQKAVLQADLVMQATKNPGEQKYLELLTIESVKTKARLSDGDGSGPLVFLNACQAGKSGNGIAGVSGFADSFLRPRSGKGASAFIGALWSVDDKLALTFAEAFYEALLQGEMLIDAVKRAREASQQQSDFTWLSYSVYGNPFATLV